jgi:hypothetical protein
MALQFGLGLLSRRRITRADRSDPVAVASVMREA